MFVCPTPRLRGLLNGDPDRSVEDKRVYQIWKGNNRFFLGGRLAFGPDVHSLVATTCLIVVPVVTFCIYIARPLMHEFTHHTGITIMVVAAFFAIDILVLLLITSTSDPGIIPRSAHPPEPEDSELGDSPGAWTGQMPRLRLPRTKDVFVNGVSVKVKYCDICMLYRPPRSSHCLICNNCVERFDHHCPWVGQCIGRRNYLFFFLFILSATLLCIYVFAMTALHISKSMEAHLYTAWRALGKSPVSIIIMVYAFIAFWFVSGLTLFHLYLISTNQTTYENFRGHYGNRVNPYDFGIAHNFKEIFCTHIPPSKNNFRANVQEYSVNTAANAQFVEMKNVASADSQKACEIEVGGWAMAVGLTYPEVDARKSHFSGMEMKSEYENHALQLEGDHATSGTHLKLPELECENYSLETGSDGAVSARLSSDGRHSLGETPLTKKLVKRTS